jgi:arylsulfatase A-like enzyme
MAAIRTRSALAFALALVGSACTENTGATPPPAPPPAPAPPAPTPSVVPAPATAAPSASAAAAPSAAPDATPPAASGPPADLNVLVISIDSLRSDMPWNGYERDIAPNLTKFEKTSVSYTRAYSVSSYTAMSLGGFLSGRYPGTLHRNGYFFEQYGDDVHMFPELLQKAGIRTINAHAHFYFDKKQVGFQRGFDVTKIVPGLEADNKTDNNVTSPKHLELAKQMLSDKASSSGRFFAWFHFLDPHDVYIAHDGYGPFGSGKKPRDKYDSEVAFTDAHVGKLIDFVDAQPWGKRTAIIVTADHGEGFGERKMHRHGFELYEVLVHVPLMIRMPGAPARRIDTPRSNIDLAPTIVDAMGAKAELPFEGQSLVKELYGAKAEERDVIVDLPRTTDNDRRRAMIQGKYKVIAYGDDHAFEVFDVVADPGETDNLKKSDRATYDRMVAAYKARVASIKDVCPKFTEKLKGKVKGKRC